MALQDRPRICVLGSINMDLVVRTTRLLAAGETILGGPFEMFPGGKGANQAVAAARMGAEVVLVGRVGDDEHGRRMIDVLRGEGVDVSRVGVAAGMATGVGLITVVESAVQGTSHGSPAVGAEERVDGEDAGRAAAPGGENTIVVASGANAAVNPADVDGARESVAHADVLLMQLEVPIETVVRAAGVARDAGTTVILNAAPGRPLPMDLLASTDVLLVNESEAAILAGPGARHNASGAGETLTRLRNTGVQTVVMTLGSRGSAYAHGAERGEAAAFAVEAVDTVAAGDAFAGTLATRWAEHQAGGGRAGLDAMAVLDILCWANAAGALACTRRGAIPSLPTRAEVVGMLRQGTAPAKTRC